MSSESSSGGNDGASGGPSSGGYGFGDRSGPSGGGWGYGGDHEIGGTTLGMEPGTASSGIEKAAAKALGKVGPSSSIGPATGGASGPITGKTTANAVDKALSSSVAGVFEGIDLGAMMDIATAVPDTAIKSRADERAYWAGLFPDTALPEAVQEFADARYEDSVAKATASATYSQLAKEQALDPYGAVRANMIDNPPPGTIPDQSVTRGPHDDPTWSRQTTDDEGITTWSGTVPDYDNVTSPQDMARAVLRDSPIMSWYGDDEMARTEDIAPNQLADAIAFGTLTGLDQHSMQDAMSFTPSDIFSLAGNLLSVALAPNAFVGALNLVEPGVHLAQLTSDDPVSQVAMQAMLNDMSLFEGVPALAMGAQMAGIDVPTSLASLVGSGVPMAIADLERYGDQLGMLPAEGRRSSVTRGPVGSEGGVAMNIPSTSSVPEKRVVPGETKGDVGVALPSQPKEPQQQQIMLPVGGEEEDDLSLSRPRMLNTVLYDIEAIG